MHERELPAAKKAPPAKSSPVTVTEPLTSELPPTTLTAGLPNYQSAAYTKSTTSAVWTPTHITSSSLCTTTNRLDSTDKPGPPLVHELLLQGLHVLAVPLPLLVELFLYGGNVLLHLCSLGLPSASKQGREEEDRSARRPTKKKAITYEPSLELLRCVRRERTNSTNSSPYRSMEPKSKVVPSMAPQQRRQTTTS